MPSSNNHGSPMPLVSFRRPILSIGSDLVHSGMNLDSSTQNLETFQRKVFTCFHDISVGDANELLSISWICKLLDAFSSCLDHFQAILTNDTGHLLKPPIGLPLSWSVPHNWLASKQLQLIANNLSPPRGNEREATDGLATVFFTMSFILMFVLWVLVVAIPCQDRGVQIHFTLPRNFPWSTPFFLLHSRIMDESKKRDRRNSNGLLKEIHQIEKKVHGITTLVDSAQFPLSEEVKEEVRTNVYELSFVCEACKN